MTVQEDRTPMRLLRLGAPGAERLAVLEVAAAGRERLLDLLRQAGA
jgi:hypothetical protein